MQIDFLSDHPHLIDSLAPPILDHWRFALPEDTLEARKERLRGHLNRKELPIAWVAHQRGEVYGTAALRMHDLEGRTDLSPWLGGVFVLPAFRRNGIGSALCMTVERHAANEGVRKLFLFTLDKEALYVRMGWDKIGGSNWRGFSGVIMAKGISPKQTPASDHYRTPPDRGAPAYGCTSYLGSASEICARDTLDFVQTIRLNRVASYLRQKRDLRPDIGHRRVRISTRMHAEISVVRENRTSGHSESLIRPNAVALAVRVGHTQIYRFAAFQHAVLPSPELPAPGGVAGRHGIVGPA